MIGVQASPERSRRIRHARTCAHGNALRTEVIILSRRRDAASDADFKIVADAKTTPLP